MTYTTVAVDQHLTAAWAEFTLLCLQHHTTCRTSSFVSGSNSYSTMGSSFALLKLGIVFTDVS